MSLRRSVRHGTGQNNLPIWRLNAPVLGSAPMARRKRQGTRIPWQLRPRVARFPSQVAIATKVALLARRSGKQMPADSGNFLENNMNAKLSIVLVASVALFVSACGSSLQSLIVSLFCKSCGPVPSSHATSRRVAKVHLPPELRPLEIYS